MTHWTINCSHFAHTNKDTIIIEKSIQQSVQLFMCHSSLSIKQCKMQLQVMVETGVATPFKTEFNLQRECTYLFHD